jgi:pimeloyl-ACP methyl ester carboxylesterase
MVYQETSVQRDQHRIYARDHGGADPPIILMHGFPDNLHLYDRLVPHLSPPRRVVTFDFLGWGSSDKPSGYPHTAANQVGDLDAVVTQLGLGQVTLVAHDASGPPAVDWALAHPERVAGLVLLNTYYCDMPTLRRPEAIWLFSTPVVRNIARPVSRMFGNWIFRRMYWWQVGRFIRDAEVRREFLPLLYQQFDATPSAQPAFFRLKTPRSSPPKSGSSVLARITASMATDISVTDQRTVICASARQGQNQPAVKWAAWPALQRAVVTTRATAIRTALRSGTRTPRNRRC